MKELDPLVIAALQRVQQKAEPKLEAALEKHGVTSPNQLPRELAAKIFQDVFIQTAVEHFPAAQIDVLKHGLAAFHHPRFGEAFPRVKSLLAQQSNAFAMATGPDAAIVLAGLGLPVAPFDRKKLNIVGTPSNNIDEVADSFSRWKTAFVGYSPCDIPFYMMFTDCVRTMRSQIEGRPELSQAKLLLNRTGTHLPSGPFPDFQHGIALFPREVGDTVSMIVLDNPNPHQGSVALYAGWTIDGCRYGAPNDGFVPVPLQFLHAALEDPQLAMWIWRPVGARVRLN